MPTPSRPLALPPPRAVRGDPFSGREAQRARRFLFGLTAFSVSICLGFAVVFLPLPILIGLVGVVIAAALLVLRPFVGLLAYALLLIIQPGELVPVLGALHVERIVGALTLLGILLEMYRSHQAILMDRSTQTRWLWFLTIAILLSIPSSIWPGRSVSTLIEMLKIVALYIMIVRLLTSRTRLRVFVGLYICLIMYLGLSSLIAYFKGELLFSQGIDRAVGLTSAGGGANELGTTMAVTVPLLLHLMGVERRAWLKGILGGAALAALYAMVVTGSRASFLGCIAGFIHIWWYSRKRVLVGAMGVIALVVGFTAIPAQYKERYTTITKSTLDGSSTGRVHAWLTGAQMVVDRPLFGVGAGCFGTAHALQYSQGLRKNWLESHSLYVQVPSELGIVGAIAFFGFMAQFLKLNRRTAASLAGDKAWRWEHRLLLALFTGFIVLIISGFFGHSLYRRTWYIYAALGLAIWRLYRNSGTEQARIE